MIPRPEKLSLVLLLLPLLAGCSQDRPERVSPRPPLPAPAVKGAPTAAVAPAPAGDRGEAGQATLSDMLMRAAFEADFHAATGVALRPIPDPVNRKRMGLHAVSAVAATLLPGGDAVLVVNAEDAGEDGAPRSSHASPGLLGVIVLQRQDGRWVVRRRHESLAALGSSGRIGEVVWTRFGPDRPGFAVIHSWTGQGHSIGLLSLFELGADGVRELTGEPIRLHSDNSGNCLDDTPQCWDIAGTWRIVAGEDPASPGDLLLQFSGEESSLQIVEGESSPPKGPRVSRPVSSSARYVFDGTRYRLADGRNVVPDL
ncbi:hypothetical protein [Caldimonas tepidiphila]|uniref:hypothetical protein n=1 Tax=Caldimonas tepidiphila TaxID=2315841 RepID=UPI00130099B5|nr:hypothetical protein [Caldimonas tepidiphila]